MSLKIEIQDVIIFNKFLLDYYMGHSRLNDDFFFDSMQNTQTRNKFFYLACILLEYMFKNGVIQRKNGSYEAHFPLNLENINMFYVYPREYTLELNDRLHKDIPNILKFLILQHKKKFV